MHVGFGASAIISIQVTLPRKPSDAMVGICLVFDQVLFKLSIRFGLHITTQYP